MRSSVNGGDDAADGSAASASYWWRSLEEAMKGQGASAQVRVVREMERLAAAGNDSLDDLRHKLLTYKAGDLWFPTGGITKQEMDIPPVITILLLGLAAAGKSSLVDLMYSVIGRAGFVPFTSPAEKDGRTLCLEEHNVLRSMRNGFCVFDSRGLDYDRMPDGLEEVAGWMENGIRHRQPCRGAEDSPAAAAASSAAKRFTWRRVNCTIVVADLYDLHQSLLSGNSAPLEATGALFHYHPLKINSSEGPILVLTHGDKLSPEERVEARVKVCGYLGVSETSGVYDTSCLNEYGAAVDEMDPTTSYAVAEAVFRALVVGDRSHRPKTRIKDWPWLALCWLMSAMAAFFAFLSSCCSQLGKVNRDYKYGKQS
ncbi:hypothetical protein Cni_G03400 [Canna indica]|uniref:P-loop containing nucleoside triphosphate hydrolase superfamily protein n=1 Tax=Canna indica TaxID=4628 RepID=A0AAQ3Q170_9LILI|nr:hypothetical protein Cni_G03400 [Canna indica]